jgi:kynureninase
MPTLDQLRNTPNALAPLYSQFRVAERLLLTGHSHQAWPDRGFEGQCQAWRDAATLVDDKWEAAFATADRVRRGLAQWLDDPGATIALGENTHDLIVKFISGLPLRERPRLVTTDGEFHTIRRQLDRLEEEGIEIVRVPALPAATAAERLSQAVTERTAAVFVSAVLFRNAHIVSRLDEVARACRAVGAELLVDVYHSTNVVPLSVRAAGLEDAYVVGGGYKYCQFGEGVGFLRVPEDCGLRPVVTGWFSEFGTMADAKSDHRVQYGVGPIRFASGTYDPTSHYRAAEVMDFFDDEGLTPEFLRQVSQHQVGFVSRCFDDLNVDPTIIDRDRSVPLEGIGGFLALKAPRAGELCRSLRERGVMTDYRADVLRVGPAPYLSDAQLAAAMDALGSAVRALG